MWLSKYFVYFVIYSCMGWIYETIYCTVKKGRWDNRGFLYGPICPIYGAGGVGITLVTDLAMEAGLTYTWVHIFVISFFGSIILEYVTSWLLEKFFHAYWWDYSKMPLNIKGRVCFPCSVGFGLAGILVVNVIAPFTRYMTRGISLMGYEFLGLLLMGFVAIDTTLTVSSLTHFERMVEAAESSLNVHMDAFVNSVVEKAQTATIASESKKEEAELKELSAEEKATLSSRLEEGKQLVAQKLAEEKERFTRESMERALSSMTFATKSALSRVQGFRRSSESGSFEINKKVNIKKLNDALQVVKGKFSRKEK